MNAVVAVVLGLGVYLIYDAWTRPWRVTTVSTRPPFTARAEMWLAGAGFERVRTGQFVVACAGMGVGAFILTGVVLGSPSIAVIALATGAYAPVSYVRARRRARSRLFTSCWPDAVDLLAGACRAGETLPGALGAVAERGPEPLRPAFRGVVSDHRVSGDLAGALERMAAGMAEPVCDRVVATLVVAHRVGGRELVRVLRTLAAFLREDAAVRKEIEARQSWTVVAARVAAGAPWLVLVLIASRPDALRAYNSGTGFAVLIAGAAATALGYRMMLVTARLAPEPRVLTPSREVEA